MDKCGGGGGANINLNVDYVIFCMFVQIRFMMS
jgi:hypothetical protein